MLEFLGAFIVSMVIIIAVCSVFGAVVALATTPMPKIKKGHQLR